MKTALPRCAFASVRSEVVNHVGNERELIMPGSVIVRAIIVRMVESELGANSNKFIRPPSNADGMFGILCGKAGPGTHLVVKVFIPHREKRARCNPKHCVIHDSPLRRITVLNRKRAALKRYLGRWMINGVVFPHVPAFGRGVDL